MKAVYQVVPDNVIGYNLSNHKWETVTLPSSNFGVFLTQYHILEVGVTDITGKEYTFLPYSYADRLLRWPGTLQGWFESIAGEALNTLLTGLPKLEFNSTFWQPLAYEPKVRFTLTPPNTHPTQDFAIDDATDIVVEVPDDQHVKFANNVLYCIDGLWVGHNYEPYGVRLQGAGDIARYGSNGNIGALVFGDIGNVKTYQLSDSDVVRVDTDRNLYTSLLVKTPESTTGKTVGIVVAGHLTWIKPEHHISDDTVLFSMANVNILDYLLETENRIDWSFIGLEDFSSSVHTARITSDDTLKKILQHVTTFLVVVDNAYLEHTCIPIAAKGAVGRFRMDDPTHLMTLGHMTNRYGYGVDYWPVWDKGVWTFHTQEHSKGNYLFRSAKWREQTIVNDAQQHQYPWSRPSVSMNYISARKIK